jgi:hypothetical protein
MQVKSYKDVGVRQKAMDLAVCAIRQQKVSPKKKFTATREVLK